MPKFVKIHNVYTVLFTFPANISNAELYYLPFVPWLRDKKVYGLTIEPPREGGETFSYGDQVYQYANAAQLASLYFTLKKNKRDIFVNYGVPLDFVTSLNNGQIRTFEDVNLWLNESHIQTTNSALFIPNVTAVLLNFLYK